MAWMVRGRRALGDAAICRPIGGATLSPNSLFVDSFTPPVFATASTTPRLIAGAARTLCSRESMSLCLLTDVSGTDARRIRRGRERTPTIGVRSSIGTSSVIAKRLRSLRTTAGQCSGSGSMIRPNVLLLSLSWWSARADSHGVCDEVPPPSWRISLGCRSSASTPAPVLSGTARAERGGPPDQPGGADGEATAAARCHRLRIAVV